MFYYQLTTLEHYKIRKQYMNSSTNLLFHRMIRNLLHQSALNFLLEYFKFSIIISIAKVFGKMLSLTVQPF